MDNTQNVIAIGNRVHDNAECTKIEKVVSATDSLTLTMRDGGGFAARFTKE